MKSELLLLVLHAATKTEKKSSMAVGGGGCTVVRCLVASVTLWGVLILCACYITDLASRLKLRCWLVRWLCANTQS